MTRDAFDSQILIPDAFRDLYLDARGRLSVGRTELQQRHELCEDLAQQLQDSARHVHFDLGVAQQDVLERVGAGLATPDSGLSAAEAGWVIGRLGELLEWPTPGG